MAQNALGLEGLEIVSDTRRFPSYEAAWLGKGQAAQKGVQLPLASEAQLPSSKSVHLKPSGSKHKPS